MNILTWTLFGLVIGLLANTLDRRATRQSLIGAIVLGIVGALTGGIIGNLLFGLGLTTLSFTQFNIQSFWLAILGSLALLFLGKILRRA